MDDRKMKASPIARSLKATFGGALFSGAVAVGGPAALGGAAAVTGVALALRGAQQVRNATRRPRPWLQRSLSCDLVEGSSAQHLFLACLQRRDHIWDLQQAVKQAYAEVDVLHSAKVSS